MAHSCEVDLLPMQYDLITSTVRYGTITIRYGTVTIRYGSQGRSPNGSCPWSHNRGLGCTGLHVGKHVGVWGRGGAFAYCV